VGARYDNLDCEDYCQTEQGGFAGRRMHKDCKDCPRAGAGVFDVHTPRVGKQPCGNNLLGKIR